MSRFSWSLREATPPTAAVEIAGTRVSAATVELRGGRYAIGAHATVPLPDGTVTPSLTAANLANRPAVLAAVQSVLSEVG